MLSTVLKGFGLGASLIIAIGAQNAFVLSSALRKQHALLIAFTCIVLDSLLIVGGIWGLGSAIETFPLLLDIALWGGAAFLFVYGLLAFWRAFKPKALEVQGISKPQTAKVAFLTVVTLSLLNPHVYLDTVILLGSIGGSLPGNEPAWFALGACLASLCWFLLLVWGGHRLAPWFQKPSSWRLLDSAIGLTMWAIALALILNS